MTLAKYYQEAGRCGRDGKGGSCVLFYHARDFVGSLQLNRRKLSRSEMTDLHGMWKYVFSTGCRRTGVLAASGAIVDTSTRCERCDNCHGGQHGVEVNITKHVHTIQCALVREPMGRPALRRTVAKALNVAATSAVVDELLVALNATGYIEQASSAFTATETTRLSATTTQLFIRFDRVDAVVAGARASGGTPEGEHREITQTGLGSGVEPNEAHRAAELDAAESLEFPFRYLARVCADRGWPKFTQLSTKEQLSTEEQLMTRLGLAEPADGSFWQYTATVELGRLPFKLNSPKLTTSKRFFRRYGSHRFLFVQVPTAAAMADKEGFRRLACGCHDVCGFEFRFFMFDIESSGGKGQSIELVFFAEKSLQRPGELSFIPVQTVRSWHIPDTPSNRQMTFAKFSQRFHLGFSATRSSITLSKDQIEVVPDIVSDSGTILSDGAGRVGVDTMERIVAAIGEAFTPFLQNRPMSNLKGTLMVDPAIIDGKIIVPKSMLKWEIPNPTPEQLTVEVNRLARPAKTVALNRQFVSALQGAGGTKESVCRHARNEPP